MTLPEAELDTERSHLAESRAALRRMRGRAEALYAAGSEVAGDPFAAETLGRALSRRVAELADDPATPLFFGRLDLADDDFHIGRRHVTDDAGEPMVLDWRAGPRGLETSVAVQGAPAPKPGGRIPAHSRPDTRP